MLNFKNIMVYSGKLVKLKSIAALIIRLRLTISELTGPLYRAKYKDLKQRRIRP